MQTTRLIRPGVCFHLLKWSFLLLAWACIPVAVKAQNKETASTTKKIGMNEWLKQMRIKPNASLNKRALKRQLAAAPATWHKVLAFFTRQDLATLPAGRYEIDGDQCYAMISEYDTRSPETVRIESHFRYIDLQYVISGKEKIGWVPVKKTRVIKAYDINKDIQFLESETIEYLDADPSSFFLFFPKDGHRPGTNPGLPQQVKKLVIKIRYADEK